MKKNNVNITIAVEYSIFYVISDKISVFFFNIQFFYKKEQILRYNILVNFDSTSTGVFFQF